MRKYRVRFYVVLAVEEGVGPGRLVFQPVVKEFLASGFGDALRQASVDLDDSMEAVQRALGKASVGFEEPGVFLVHELELIREVVAMA